MIRSSGLAALVLAAIGCGGDAPFQVVGGGIDPRLSTIQAQIFTPRCAISGCHGPPQPELGQDLSEGSARANLVNVPSVERPDLDRVEPGDAAASYLFKKITGAPDIVGDRMPLGESPLTAEEIEAIRLWIENGAPAD